MRGELRATFAELGPVARAWTLVGRGPVAFWHRRQLHETPVHLWDLRSAAGRGVDAPSEVWADAADEVVTMFQPLQVRLGRTPPLARDVALVADDAQARWLLGAHQPARAVRIADVTVTGSARALGPHAVGPVDT